MRSSSKSEAGVNVLPDGMREPPAGTHVSGYLRKNHRGGAFKTRSERRFFVSVGFNVQYFTSDDRGSKRCGRSPPSGKQPPATLAPRHRRVAP